MKDIFGQIIEVGDWASWPTRFSSTMVMLYGTVTEVTDKRVTIACHNAKSDWDQKTAWTEQARRVTCVKRGKK